MNKKWLYIASIICVGFAVVVGLAVNHRDTHAEAHSLMMPSATPSALRIEESGNSTLPKSGEQRPEAKTTSTGHQVSADGKRLADLADPQRVADSAAFRAFVKDARLDADQQRTIARIVALYHRNDASLEATTTSAERATMHRQLVGDTVAQIQVRIPQSSWDAFARSGLVAAGEPVNTNPI